jgi:hypothetical protein
LPNAEEAEPEVEPDAVADDLAREAVVLIAVDGWCVHATSMSHLVGLNRLTKPLDLLFTTILCTHDKLHL